MFEFLNGVRDDLPPLRPFFPYYGGKFRIAPQYPRPHCKQIIEPFAGSAGYSLHYYDRNVLLCDRNPILYNVWKYLIKTASEKEIRALPLEFDNVHDLDIHPEAKRLIGFWLNKATTEPGNTPSKWQRSGIRPDSHWGEVIRERIASQLQYIKHWRVLNASFHQLPNREATWYIDPPYCGKQGHRYRYKIDDYEALGRWAMSRRGQVIVCERDDADWLPFEFLCDAKASGDGVRKPSHVREVMWHRGRGVAPPVEEEAA